jgi:hypothetical protein
VCLLVALFRWVHSAPSRGLDAHWCPPHVRLPLFPNAASVQGTGACQLVWGDCRSYHQRMQQRQVWQLSVSDATGSYAPWSGYLRSYLIKQIRWSGRHIFMEWQHLLTIRLQECEKLSEICQIASKIHTTEILRYRYKQDVFSKSSSPIVQVKTEMLLLPPVSIFCFW